MQSAYESGSSWLLNLNGYLRENIDLVCDFLKKENYMVSVAENGEKALKLFEAYGAKLIILDIMLPGMDGFAVCSKIRENANTHILIASARTEKADKLKGLNLGADDYIEKPYDIDILLAKNGTTGIAAIVDREEIFDIYVSLALLRPIEINSVYLWAAINSVETKQQFDASLKGIGVPNLHLGEIKKARIIVPPVEEQNQFAEFVKKTDKSKLAIQQSLDKMELLKKALMQKYFG